MPPMLDTFTGILADPNGLRIGSVQLGSCSHLDEVLERYRKLLVYSRLANKFVPTIEVVRDD